MDSPTRTKKGCLRKALLALVIIAAVLGFLSVKIGDAMVKAQIMSCMSNAKQIHLATTAMVEDGKTNHNPRIGWPGDLKANGYIKNLSDFVHVFVRNDYLKPGDLCVFCAAGVKAYNFNQSNSSDPNTVLEPPFTEANNAFKIYLVKKDDPPDTIFLATKNFTYGKPLDPKAVPFGDKGFMVMRKDGSAIILRGKQAQDFKLIGKLPGGGTVESEENCLNPSKPTQ